MKKLLFFILVLFPVMVLAQGTGSTTISFTPAPGDITFTILQSWYGVVDGVLAGTGSQLFGTLFGIFNSGVLTLAGIIVTYTLMVSTLNTAHEGEVLGKQFSSVWIPFRTIGGIALLIPKASGYSLIQIFMMWIAVQGIGLADTIWYATIDYFTSGNQGMISIQAPGSFGYGSGAGASNPVSDATNILRSLTCMYIIQNQFQQVRVDQQRALQPPNPTPPDLFSTVTTQFNALQGSSSGGGTINFPGNLSTTWSGTKYGVFGSTPVCGSLTWNPVTPSSFMYQNGRNGALQPQYANITSQIASQKLLALQSMVNALAGPAQAIANNYVLGTTNAVGIGQFNNNDATTWVNGNTNHPGGAPLTQGGVIQNPAATYVGLMLPTLNQLSQSSGNAAANSSTANELKEGGWAMAGATIFKLTQQAQSASTMNTSALAISTTPPGPTLVQQGSAVYNFFNCQTPLNTYCTTISNLVLGPNAGTGNVGACNDNNLTVGPSCNFVINAGAYSGQFLSASSTYNASNRTSFSNDLGEATGALNDLGGLISGLTNGGNPLVAAASLGSALINIFMVMWVAGATLSTAITAGLAAIPSFNLSNPVNNLLGWIMSFISPFIIVLFTTGIVLAFYLPMIPYILFTFGVIGWFITVLEAMIAAPLVAIGIAHPEGHAILGKADPAVLLIVNVFLRPTLMILGMLGGIFLSYAGMWLLNAGFSMAWESATSPVSGITSIFTGLGGAIVYTIIALQIVQKSFSLVYVIPDEVFKWIGGNIKGMGGEAEAESKIAGAVDKGAGAGGEVMKSRLGDIGAGGGAALGKRIGGKLAKSGEGKEENKLEADDGSDQTQDAGDSQAQANVGNDSGSQTGGDTGGQGNTGGQSTGGQTTGMG